MPIRTVTYHVEVYYKNIAAMFQVGGEASEWIYKITVQQMELAKRTAPSRTGNLVRSHRINTVSVRDGFFGNQYVRSYEIENFSDHAAPVHDGRRAQEGDRFLPRGGPGRNSISKYVGQPFPRGTLAKGGVAAQQAHPWLRDACAKIAEANGAMMWSV